MERHDVSALLTLVERDTYRNEFTVRELKLP